MTEALAKKHPRLGLSFPSKRPILRLSAQIYPHRVTRNVCHRTAPRTPPLWTYKGAGPTVLPAKLRHAHAALAGHPNRHRAATI